MPGMIQERRAASLKILCCITGGRCRRPATHLERAAAAKTFGQPNWLTGYREFWRCSVPYDRRSNRVSSSGEGINELFRRRWASMERSRRDPRVRSQTVGSHRASYHGTPWHIHFTRLGLLDQPGRTLFGLLTDRQVRRGAHCSNAVHCSTAELEAAKSADDISPPLTASAAGSSTCTPV